MNNQPKCVIIGLDGMNWKIINLMIKKGIFSNIEKLIKQGNSGILKSTYPPVTGPAWTSMATGLKTSKHKCFNWFVPGENLNEFHPISSKNINGKTFYEILRENQKRSVIINLPNSYPPKLPTPTITCLMTRGTNCVFPIDLKEKYPALQKYRIAPNESLRIKNKMDDYIKDIISLEEDRFKGVQALFKNEPWDLFFYLFSGTDFIQHRRYDKIIADQDKISLRYYKFVDMSIGWLIRTIPKNCHIIIMSDHGFKTYHKIFYLNHWLKENGYLKTKPAEKVTDLYNTAISRNRGEIEKKGIFIKINNKNLRLIKKIPFLAPILRRIKNTAHITVKEREEIDLKNTQACLPKGTYYGCIYLNDKIRFPKSGTIAASKINEVRQEIKNKLLEFNQQTKIAEKIFTKEEIYPNYNPTDRLPDFFFELADSYIENQFVSAQNFKDKIKNAHHMDGIIISCGPKIKQNHKIINASIYDITPTILNIFNINSNQKFDGKILNIFSKNKNNLDAAKFYPYGPGCNQIRRDYL